MKTLLTVILFLSVSLFGASFKCKRTSSDIEKMICTNYELSHLDDKLSTIYSLENEQVYPNHLQEQLTWLKERNTCKNIQCIKIAYKKRIDELSIRNRYIFTYLTQPKHSPTEQESIQILNNQLVQLKSMITKAKKYQEVTAFAGIDGSGTEYCQELWEILKNDNQVNIPNPYFSSHGKNAERDILQKISVSLTSSPTNSQFNFHDIDTANFRQTIQKILSLSDNGVFHTSIGIDYFDPESQRYLLYYSQMDGIANGPQDEIKVFSIVLDDNTTSFSLGKLNIGTTQIAEYYPTEGTPSFMKWNLSESSSKNLLNQIGKEKIAKKGLVVMSVPLLKGIFALPNNPQTVYEFYVTKDKRDELHLFIENLCEYKFKK